MSQIQFPTKDSMVWWTPDAALLDQIAATYGTVDVDAELLKARAWCMANPRRRKTAAGMPRFIVNWLNKAGTMLVLAQPVRRHSDIPRGRDVWQRADAYARSRAGR